MTRRAVILFWRLTILVALLVVWQWGFEWSKALLPKAYVPKILDPYFIAKPSAIWQSWSKVRLACDPAMTSMKPWPTNLLTACGPS